MTPLLYLIPAAIAAYALLGKKTSQPGTSSEDRLKQLLAVETSTGCGDPGKLAWLLVEYRRLGETAAAKRVTAKQKLCLEGLSDPKKQKLAQLATALGEAVQSCDIRALQWIESEYRSLGEAKAASIVGTHIQRCSGPTGPPVAPPQTPAGESKAEAIARLTRASAIAVSKGDIATLRVIAVEYRQMGEYEAARYVDGLIVRLSVPPPTVVTPPPNVILPPITPPFVPPAPPSAPPLVPPPVLPPVLPPVVVEPPGRAAAQQLVAHLRGRKKGSEDRAQVASFQRIAALKDDGLYGPGTARAVGAFGVIPAPVLYWPKSWYKAKKDWNKYIANKAAQDAPRAMAWAALRTSI